MKETKTVELAAGVKNYFRNLNALIDAKTIEKDALITQRQMLFNSQVQANKLEGIWVLNENTDLEWNSENQPKEGEANVVKMNQPELPLNHADEIVEPSQEAPLEGQPQDGEVPVNTAE